MEEEKVHISVVSPVYGCSTSLLELYIRLKKTLEEITPDFEIILVNDASPDNAWEVIKEICQKDTRVKGINLSRNFGQHYALTAGLDYTRGEWVVVMDCDLQDSPEEIIKLYNMVVSGYDIVLGKRIIRKDVFLKRIASKLFYFLFYLLTDVKMDQTVGTYRIMSKNVVVNFRKFREQSRFFGGIINWMGFNVTTLEIKHEDRKYGKTSYNISKLVKMALNNILSFSDKLLKVSIKLGFTLVIISGIFISYKIIQSLFSETKLIGWSSLIATVLFSTGLIVSVLGIIGIYVGKVFEQTKERPLYIIAEDINLNEQK